MSIENHLDVSIRASYRTLNELTDKTERVWLVCHGQGQLSEYFIKKFEILDAEKNFILAPQGLSKYYLEGFSGRVGASWMTKEDRLTEIDNQYRFLSSVLDNHKEVLSKELILFGFSQGAATIGRFAANAKIPFSKMVIWAGTFPPDIEPNAYNFLTGEEEIIYFTSRTDPFFKEEMIDAQNDVMERTLGKRPKLNWYEGGHKVIPEILLTI